jgi:uncharacterized protein (DUF2147 family)
MKNLLLTIFITCATIRVSLAGSADAIVGIWANSSNKAHINIYRQNGRYFGKIIWLKAPTDDKGMAKVDKNNPVKDFRTKPLLGLLILRDFKYDDEEWKDGKIYNPEDGKEYKAFIKVKDARTLFVRGYIGFSFIGKTEIFHRIK